ncbi:carboxyl transferase domain-containing protein [Cristinia sonorae]|uniref:Carboxyl transferase domain-containing protein n=1 Tax=Cristinia sonorae TaxID=1940300 RepID=A0A8K0XLU4_9AGAR|nr:carboxyl transferase domain-containing protein [Cristinia sonorae]
MEEEETVSEPEEIALGSGPGVGDVTEGIPGEEGDKEEVEGEILGLPVALRRKNLRILACRKFAEIRHKITDIVGIQDGLGVECLKESGLIAGETSRAYDDIFTITLVAARSVGTGAYLVRLGDKGLPLPVLESSDTWDRDIGYNPPKGPYDPRRFIEGKHDETTSEWQSGFLVDERKPSLLDALAWVLSLSRLALLNVSFPLTPPTPHRSSSPSSTSTTRDCLLIIFANWRGFSGGQQDVYDEILEQGSEIVDDLSSHKQPVFVYIVRNGELRGSAWVVLDPSGSINSQQMETYADVKARAGVLEQPLQSLTQVDSTTDHREAAEALEKLDLTATVAQLKADHLMRSMLALAHEDRKAALNDSFKTLLQRWQHPPRLNKGGSYRLERFAYAHVCKTFTKEGRKLKCDGRSVCANCNKRGIPCTYIPASQQN